MASRQQRHVERRSPTDVRRTKSTPDNGQTTSRRPRNIRVVCFCREYNAPAPTEPKKPACSLSIKLYIMHSIIQCRNECGSTYSHRGHNENVNRCAPYKRSSTVLCRTIRSIQNGAFCWPARSFTAVHCRSFVLQRRRCFYRASKLAPALLVGWRRDLGGRRSAIDVTSTGSGQSALLLLR